ncbi:hypothetical protein UlMin_037515 [Ulmus minor]
METEITVLLPSESEPSSPKSSPSSSSSPPPSPSSSSPLNDSRKKYDVFLNFRGEDTRKTFMGHLRAALYTKGIETFIDDDQMERGRYISSQLLQAIENSTCSIIIFSENYASSTWCLDELVKILDCMKNKGQFVIPIFYHVDPSDVRKQTGIFGSAFARHEENLRDDKKRVQSWRDALTKITGVAGLDLRNYRDEADFIRDIVEEVSRKVSTLLVSSPQISNKDDHSFLAKLYSCGSATFSAVIIFLVFFLVFFPLLGLFFFKILVPLFEKILGFGNSSHNW